MNSPPMTNVRAKNNVVIFLQGTRYRLFNGQYPLPERGWSNENEKKQNERGDDVCLFTGFLAAISFGCVTLLNFLFSIQHS